MINKETQWSGSRPTAAQPNARGERSPVLRRAIGVARQGFKHPLEDVTLLLIAKAGAVDRTSLANDLGAPTRPPKGFKAYLVLAEDLLGCLLMDGLVWRDDQGWYRVKGAKP